MTQDLLSEVERFAREFNLSDHRVGMVLVRNGRLVERLRDPSRRLWPETIERVWAALDRERNRRMGSNPKDAV